VILSLVVVAVLFAISVRDPVLGGKLVDEDSVAEGLQVVLAAGAGVLAFRQGRAARRAGQPATLEVAIVAAMVVICIGEIDLDRMLFGTKVISTRFFVNPKHSLAARALAVAVVVGAPLALGVWLLVHVRHLWRSGMDGLRQPWGQLAAFGMALFVAVEIFERPLGHLRSLPPHFAEEALELVSAICIFFGLAARRRALMNRMFVRPLIVVTLVTLGLVGCRGEHPAAAQETPKPLYQVYNAP
jgi:hypothetical protein